MLDLLLVSKKHPSLTSLNPLQTSIVKMNKNIIVGFVIFWGFVYMAIERPRQQLRNLGNEENMDKFVMNILITLGSQTVISLCVIVSLTTRYIFYSYLVVVSVQTRQRMN